MARDVNDKSTVDMAAVPVFNPKAALAASALVRRLEMTLARQTQAVENTQLQLIAAKEYAASLSTR